MRPGLRRVQTEVPTDDTAPALPVEGRDYRTMWFTLRRAVQDMADDAKNSAMSDKTIEEIRLRQGIYRCAEAVLNHMQSIADPTPPDPANQD